MSIISLEAKFKEIEQRENNLNNFFSPYTSQGPKHYCVKDLQSDHEYDTLLYGLSRYYQLKAVPIVPRQSINPSELSKPKDSTIDGDISNLLQKSNLSNLNSTESVPKILTKDTNLPKFSKLQSIKLIEKCKISKEDEYIGAFSSTRVAPIRKRTDKYDTNARNSPEWRAIGYPPRVSNKSALDYLKIDLDHKEHSEINLFKKVQRLKTQLKPSEARLENNYQEKPYLKFKLTEEKISKVSERIPQEQKWFDIKYNPSTYLEPKINGTVTIISVDSYDQEKFIVKTKINDRIYLPGIPWLKDWKNRTLRVQTNTDSSVFQEYYMHLSDFSDSAAKKSEKDIDSFLCRNAPQHEKHSLSPVMPLTLKKLSEKSPLRSKSTIRLPKIQQKSVETPCFKYINPITKGLVAYRESLCNFHPNSFPATLSVFELHDFLENRYKKESKEKEYKEIENIELGVEGKRLINS